MQPSASCHASLMLPKDSFWRPPLRQLCITQQLIMLHKCQKGREWWESWNACSSSSVHNTNPHLHLGLRIQAADHCIQARAQLEVLQLLILLPDGVLCIYLGALHVPLLNGLLDLHNQAWRGQIW